MRLRALSGLLSGELKMELSICYNLQVASILVNVATIFSMHRQVQPTTDGYMPKYYY